ERNHYHVDPGLVTRTVVGILISYILFPSTPDFSMMDEREREKTISTHVDTVYQLLTTSK
ncbi:MAG: hypothetical protein ACOCSM_01765, partial [Bacillota bacterium]